MHVRREGILIWTNGQRCQEWSRLAKGDLVAWPLGAFDGLAFRARWGPESVALLTNASQLCLPDANRFAA